MPPPAEASTTSSSSCLCNCSWICWTCFMICCMCCRFFMGSLPAQVFDVHHGAVKSPLEGRQHRVAPCPLTGTGTLRHSLGSSFLECNINSDRLAEHLLAHGCESLLVLARLHEIDCPRSVPGVDEMNLAVLKTPSGQRIQATTEELGLIKKQGFDRHQAGVLPHGGLWRAIGGRQRRCRPRRSGTGRH